ELDDGGQAATACRGEVLLGGLVVAALEDEVDLDQVLGGVVLVGEGDEGRLVLGGHRVPHVDAHRTRGLVEGVDRAAVGLDGSGGGGAPVAVGGGGVVTAAVAARRGEQAEGDEEDEKGAGGAGHERCLLW